jgi:hypothetical protein
MGKRRVIAFSLLMLLLVFGGNNIPYVTYSASGSAQNGLYGHSVSLASATHGGCVIEKPTVKKEHVRVRYMGGESCYVVPAFFEQHAPRAHHVQVHDHFRIAHITALPYVSITLRGPPHTIACIC